MKKSIVLATAVASVLSSGVALAELSANASVTSNYIWRGVTQTNDAAAVQGGIDWGHDSGLYAGTWLSNVAFGNSVGAGYEMDLYVGFAGDLGGFGYDLGVASYQYPLAPSTSFTEAYITGTASIVTVGLWYTVDAASGNENNAFDSGDMYVSASLDFPVAKTDMSIYAGSYMFDADGTGTDKAGELDYAHVGASISKDGFTFAVDKNDVEATNAFFALAGDGSDDNVRFSVSYAVDFEL